MSTVAIILIVVSAVMHAGWNLVTKSRHPTASFFMVANLAGSAALVPVALLQWETLVRGLPPRVWLLLAATGFCMTLYYVSLAAAYRSGHMSIAYPLARALPVLLVSGITFLLGRGEQITIRFLVGGGLIVSGCLLLPMRRFRELRPGLYLNPTCLLALGAALGTTGYSMLDDEALRLLRESVTGTGAAVRVTLLYACLEGLTTAVWLGVFICSRRAGRVDLAAVLRPPLRRTALGAGVVIYLAYSIVLVSMAFVHNVSYVVAFRQLSIPIGAALGILLLKEPAHRPKLLGVALMFAGLVLVATG